MRPFCLSFNVIQELKEDSLQGEKRILDVKGEKKLFFNVLFSFITVKIRMVIMESKKKKCVYLRTTQTPRYSNIYLGQGQNLGENLPSTIPALYERVWFWWFWTNS